MPPGRPRRLLAAQQHVPSKEVVYVRRLLIANNPDLGKGGAFFFFSTC
jgi:hypothetical protein